jgi:hypothetical protein
MNRKKESQEMGKCGRTWNKILIGNFICIGWLLFAPIAANSCDCETCGGRDRASSTVDRQKNNPQSFIKDELYFGLSVSGEKKISEAQWQLFLSRVITPRFHEGLTVLDANGQYLNSSGKLIQENTKLVIIVYQGDRVKAKLVEEIVEIYKKMFHQESVLRVTSSARVSF